MLPEGPQLRWNLDHWQVTLVSGEVLRIMASAAKESKTGLQFVALAMGEPDYEVEIAWLPRSIIESWNGPIYPDAS